MDKSINCCEEPKKRTSSVNLKGETLFRISYQEAAIIFSYLQVLSRALLQQLSFQIRDPRRDLSVRFFEVGRG
ncbi:unnamed protein product [Moneuplotes crassus]|uniref:Uncharacterized protein n=1 Tax=Euplotes crassus TaxID=5936 RepID=A0AAD1XCF5_EUPCR|nr:unnamed protein product [Moneuplotes crassus]